jgi:membrane protease YdiL (CAAX protease family)
VNPESLSARWASVHAGILIVALVVVALCWPALSWPGYLLVPLASYFGMVAALPVLRQSSPRFDIGRVDGWPLLTSVVLSSATAVVLLAYDAAIRPDVSELAAIVPVEAFGNIILAWACFSLLNAAMEELIFRGVLYQAILAEWGTTTAIGVSAVLFGLGHMRGYPPGPLGAFLAAGYGVALGLLRWWTGGLGLAVACHVSADATIFGLLVRARAWDSPFPN